MRIAARFGGSSPFDPRSVVLSHALPLVVTFVVMGAIVRYALRAAIRTARRASGLVTEVFVAFLRKLQGDATSPGMVQRSAFILYVVHGPLAIVDGSLGLRATRSPPGRSNACEDLRARSARLSPSCSPPL
jgi:hypothetical protein